MDKSKEVIPQAKKDELTFILYVVTVQLVTAGYMLLNYDKLNFSWLYPYVYFLLSVSAVSGLLMIWIEYHKYNSDAKNKTWYEKCLPPIIGFLKGFFPIITIAAFIVLIIGGTNYMLNLRANPALSN